MTAANKLNILTRVSLTHVKHTDSQNSVWSMGNCGEGEVGGGGGGTFKTFSVPVQEATGGGDLANIAPASKGSSVLQRSCDY